MFVNSMDKDGKVTVEPPKEPSKFAKYVKANYILHRVPGRSHGDVMKILSDNFGKLNVNEKLQL